MQVSTSDLSRLCGLHRRIHQMDAHCSLASVATNGHSTHSRVSWCGSKLGSVTVIRCCRWSSCAEHDGTFVISLTITCVFSAVVTREIKLFLNVLEITSVSYFTRNHVWNWNNIISAAGGVLKLFQNYFSDNKHVWKYSWAAVSLWKNFEIISRKFPGAEIKLFQMVVHEGWNNFEIIISHVTTA